MDGREAGEGTDYGVHGVEDIMPVSQAQLSCTHLQACDHSEAVKGRWVARLVVDWGVDFFFFTWWVDSLTSVMAVSGMSWQPTSCPRWAVGVPSPLPSCLLSYFGSPTAWQDQS